MFSGFKTIRQTVVITVVIVCYDSNLCLLQCTAKSTCYNLLVFAQSIEIELEILNKRRQMIQQEHELLDREQEFNLKVCQFMLS